MMYWKNAFNMTDYVLYWVEQRHVGDKSPCISSRIRNLIIRYPWMRNTGTGITLYLYGE